MTTTAPPFRITERDIAILQAIARYRFLTAELVQRAVGGSRRGVGNRMRLLAAHAYLVRVATIVTRPVAYGLANRGARFLAEHACDIDHRLDWGAKNDTTHHFLAHTLAVAETMLRIEIATRDFAVRFIDHHELLSEIPEPTQRARDPFCVRVSVRHGRQDISIAAVPDRLFSLAYPDGTQHNFALELDRGTMDIWANRIVGKSSLRRKFLAYHTAREQRRHTDVWGFQSFRVLVVTTSEERIRNMIDAQRRATPQCPAGFFLYSTADRIAAHGALGPAWSTSKCDNVQLLHDVQRAHVHEAPARVSVDGTAPSLRVASVKPATRYTIRTRA